MSWNYTKGPVNADRDKVRFYVGDTDESDQLVQDEEIAFAVAEHSDLRIAAAMVLRALAAKHSRLGSISVGSVSQTLTTIAKAFADRAKELDPFGYSIGGVLLLTPKFGGLSISEKEVLADDTDAVQPSFAKGMNDIPGGPSDSVKTDDDNRIR
jgi:hypothetical protein